MKLTEVHPGYKAMTDEQLANHIRERLGMNPQWARRALLALYDEQTEAEQQDPENVHESNGRGFSENDQKFLSSLADKLVEMKPSRKSSSDGYILCCRSMQSRW